MNFKKHPTGEKSSVGCFFVWKKMRGMEMLRICYKNEIKVLIYMKNMLYFTYIKSKRCMYEK